MTLNLVNYRQRVQEAVQFFWDNREAARQKQIAAGTVDQGERAGVTSGKNMDGFIDLLVRLTQANGLAQAEIHQKRVILSLPGYFRPTKLWDLLILYQGELIAAVELKSQVGPSFGNNFNNRAEESIGTAQDFWTAYREGAFGKQPRPFLGWLMLAEDAPASRTPVREVSPHFPVFEEFENASYLKRYDLLCRKLAQEGLYTSAALVTSQRSAIETGDFSSMSSMTDIKAFVTSFAGHIAAQHARLKK